MGTGIVKCAGNQYSNVGATGTYDSVWAAGSYRIWATGACRAWATDLYSIWAACTYAV